MTDRQRYGMVASTNPGWPQTESKTLTGLFDWVRLKANVKDTIEMVCHPCSAAGVWSYKDYTYRMTGVGRIYKEQQRERVKYPECRKYLARGSLTSHRQTQHNVAKEGPGQEGYG